MVKTLSLKTTDETYFFVDNLPGNHSFHLRRALEEYLERHYGYKKNNEKNGISPINSQSVNYDGNDADDDLMHGIHSHIDNLENINEKNK